MDKNIKKNEAIKQDEELKKAEELKEAEDLNYNKIQELEEKVKEYEEKWKRALADYQNQEKWIREQRSEWIKSSNRDLLLRILPVLDTLMLAQQHSPVPDGKGHSQDQTLKVSVDQFLTILKDEGVTKIDTSGKDFDPFLMEAITTEDGEENKVIREVRTGYMLADKVLRPAQVTVGKSK